MKSLRTKESMLINCQTEERADKNVGRLGKCKEKISARSQQTQTLYLQEQAVAYKLMFAFLRIHNQKWNLRCGVKCSSSAKQALSM